MEIKSLFLACSLLACGFAASAQKAELSNAKSSYEKFSQLKNANTLALGIPNLNTAKTSIDKAAANAKTQNDPSTWTYRALIYTDLALLDTVPAKSEPLISEASTSLKKAVELDKSGENKAQIETAGRMIGQYNLNKGVREFQAKSYTDAYNSFNNGLNFVPNDTTLTYYAALSAINSKEYPKAIEKYTSLVKTNFSQNSQVYLDLSRLYAAEKDTANAIKAAADGSAKFPNNSQLATQEIELNLLSGKQKDVIEKISAQAQKEPTNKTYPFYLGVAYNSLKDYAKAEEAYKKAVAIDPNFFDANVNLGGLILNSGIDMYNKANKLPANKQQEYTAMIKKANAEFDRALPYLQKAADVNPKSRVALENLRTYYVVKKNQAKVDEIKKQLASLPE